MNKRRITSFTLSLLACVSTSSIAPLLTDSVSSSAMAASSSSHQSATGLDARSLQMANRGDWLSLIDHLQSLTDGATTPNNNHAWLAFGLMFQEKCEDLKSLSQKVDGLAGTDKNNHVAKLVECFSLACQRKLDEAQKVAEELAPDGKSDDVLVNLAIAATSAKSGQGQKAIDYCTKVVTQAPDFAWGYRTIGLIQERTLKNPIAAEEAYAKALAIQPDCKEVRDLVCDLHIGRNDFDGAIDSALEAIKASPRDPVSYYRLSQIYTQQWRLREADAQLDKAIRLAPDNAKYHRAKASILRYERKLTEAITQQQRAVDLSSDKPFELTELAALNELAGNDSAAADNLKQAIALSPLTQGAHQAAQQKLVQLLIKGQRWDDLITEFKRAVEAEPNNAGLHLGLADAYMRANKTDECLDELKKAADLDQNDVRPHRMLGALYTQKHDFAKAQRAYTRALNINPSSVEDLVALGYTYAQNDDYMQAETSFVTALALQQLTQSQGNREQVMRSLATLLLAEGRYTEATLNYEEILRAAKGPNEAQDSFMLAQSKALRDRTSTAAQEAVKSFDALSETDKGVQRAGMVETLLRLGKPDMALQQLGKLPESAQKDCGWLTLFARAYRLKGDLAKAEDYANKAVASNEDNKEIMSEANTELAQVLLAKGNLNGADAAVRKATDLNGKSFNAYEVMGRIYLKRGDSEHAIEAAKHATDINPYFTQAYLLNGDAYAASNKYGEAANNYKRAVELYPSFIDAHKSLRDAYKKLVMKDEAQKEEQQITQLEQNG